MPDTPQDLVFTTNPIIEFGSNTFENVPVILQYEDRPLLEVVQVEQAGFTTKFRIYNADGAYLAKVVGSRLFLTDDGANANLTLRHPPRMTVCELNGRTLFEIRRREAAALSTDAELFTPDGRFIRSNNNGVPAGLFRADGSSLQVGGMLMMQNRFRGCRIGVLIKSDGAVAIGVS